MSVTNKSPNTDILWQKMVMKYTKPDMRKSIWQICNSFIPYILLWIVMYQSFAYSYIYTLILAVPASGFLVRLFIIFHDCGHGSFFRSRRANKVVGTILGILTFTPYDKWHDLHHQHHASTGNLDKRGTGDVWTMTIREYMEATPAKRLIYRLFRNPFFMFTFGPMILILLNRITVKEMDAKAKRDVYYTNIAVVVMGAIISYFIGFKAYLLIQMPILLISHTAGLWLFYIQHQFEDVTWERTESWDYKEAAIRGSSFLKLPAILQWFTGNIGFHHVHHLSSRIPNYNLARCHYENELFREVKPIVLSATFRALQLNLWDEANSKLISFKSLNKRKEEQQAVFIYQGLP